MFEEQCVLYTVVFSLRVREWFLCLTREHLYWFCYGIQLQFMNITVSFVLRTHWITKELRICHMIVRNSGILLSSTINLQGNAFIIQNFYQSDITVSGEMCSIPFILLLKCNLSVLFCFISYEFYKSKDKWEVMPNFPCWK